MLNTVLIIGLVNPEPESSAAGSRLLQILLFFKKINYRVVFATSANASSFSVDLKALAIEHFSIELNSESFDAFLTTINPNIVLFDRFITEEQFSWRVAKQCPNALRILDTEDLHCLRLARQEALKQNLAFTESSLLNSDLSKREIASIYRSDLSLIISEYEMQILKEVFRLPPTLLHYLPLMLDESKLLALDELPSFEERRHFVSIGNFLHPPNWDAVQYLKAELWPLIRKRLPGVELHIYGAYATEKHLHLSNTKEGFIVKGRANSALKVISNARVLLAPLRFGAGIKGKLLEAMQYGTPSVSSSIGAEGMGNKENWNGAVCDDRESFAKEALRLYTEKDIFLQAQLKGREIIRAKFLSSAYLDALEERIQDAQVHLSAKRRENFIGAMLQQENLLSKKFLAKWIEEKAKK
ncbi:MAG: glycosyltransferase [Chitinophagales bacterium]